jgi:hypothetical protein
MVVIDCQTTDPTTTAPVSLLRAADGTPALLGLEEGLINALGKTSPAELCLLAFKSQTPAANEFTVGDTRELTRDLPLSAELAISGPVLNETVLDCVKSAPSQVNSNPTEVLPGSASDFPNRTALPVKVDHLVQ